MIQDNNAPTRIALFTVMGFSIETAVQVINERPDTELAMVLTCTGPKSRRSSAHFEVIETLWEQKLPNVDVIVSNKRSQYSDLCALYKVDLIVSVGFPWLLPASLLQDKRIRYGAINFHNSQLPLLRGPNALGHAIVNGDTTLHYVCHRMSPEFDTGNVLVRGQAHLDTNAHFSGVYWPHSLMKDMVQKAIDLVKVGTAGEVQVGPATEAPKFDPEFRWIDFQDTAKNIHNKVRAFYGSRDIPKGALARLQNGQIICITKSCVGLEDETWGHWTMKKHLPGTILERKGDKFEIMCGDQTLEFHEWNLVDGAKEDLGCDQAADTKEVDVAMHSQKKLRMGVQASVTVANAAA